MNLFQELRQRRVFQITSGYVLGSWGILQFFTFLESRMTVSPHMVNLLGLALLFLLPSVITMAWVHGRPGKDTWGRTPKIVIPANLVAVILVLVILFNGQDLGAVTETIAVEDENGAVTERIVPKNEYRRRVLVFYPENGGGEEDAWASETMSFLLSMDLSQDGFVDVILPLAMPNSFLEAGSPDGHGLARPLQRKLARDAHLDLFLTGTISTQAGGWRLETELQESETGKVVAQRTDEAADLFTLADLVSRHLREDLGIPAAHLENNPDLPVAELTSSDIEAVANHMRAILLVTHGNDWEGAAPLLEDAVGRDEQFALAQFILFNVYQSLGDEDGASEAIATAMANLYRVPERVGFMIKAQYYYNEKMDPDKAQAVVRMWTQIYPDDVNAYNMEAMFHFVRQEIPQAIVSYEKILEIDPSRVEVLEELADLHTQLGNYDEAEDCLQRYVEIYPTRPKGYEDLSDFYSSIGRLDDARDALAQAELLDPENKDLTLSRIDLDIKVGKYDESETALEVLLNEVDTPRDSLRIYARSLNLAMLRGREKELIANLEVFYALLLETQNPLQAHIIYSMTLPALSQVGQPEGTLKRLAEVKASIPETYQGLVGVGEAWAYADLGRVDEARTSLAKADAIVEAFKFETFRSSLALVEGMIDEATGDLEAAIVHYRDANEKAIRLEPSYMTRYARAMRLIGKNDEAMAQIQESLKTDPAHPNYHLELAHLAHDEGNLAKARDHLAIALEAWDQAGPDYLPAKEAQQLAGLLDAH